MSGAAGVLAALLLAATPPPSPSAPPGYEVVGPRATGEAVTFPVQDVSGRVQDLVFGQASADGAVTDRGGREFRLSSDVLFAFDRADLTPRARTELARIAATITAQPGVRSVSITGYTDAQGAPAYNVGLSRRRADAVRAALAPALPGVALTAAGRGEESPIATNDTDPGRALNRRVEIRATG